VAFFLPVDCVISKNGLLNSPPAGSRFRTNSDPDSCRGYPQTNFLVNNAG